MQENDIKITIRTLVNLGQITALKALRDDLKRDYELAEAALLKLDRSKPVITESVKTDDLEEYKKEDTKYNPSWSFSNKFLYILKRERRFLKFRDAAKIIVEIEGFGDVGKLTKRLTSSTRPIKEDGTIVKIKPGTSAVKTYWGSPKWLDADGNIKPDHMYKEEDDTLGSKKIKLFEL